MPLSALNAPTERTAPPRDLEIRPKQVKAWLDSLPIARAVEAGTKLILHASALNRAKVDLDVRLQILEIYRPFAATLFDELDAIYAKAALPLGPRGREALNLARGLAAEIAAGYKIALFDQTGKLISFGGKKQLPALVLRAIHYLSIELRASYKSYSPVPGGIWNDLHHLYLFADEKGIASEIGDAESKTTVHEAYTETLLLSLTDPYRLVQGEVDRIVAQLRSTRAIVTLGRERPVTRASAHFLVPCDTDKPPKPALSATDDTGGPNWRLLDSNPLVDKLRARKSAIETGNASATTTKSVGAEGLALLGKLMLLWGDPPKRAHRRDPMETSIAICVGLKSVGHFVSLQPKIDAANEAEVIRKGITIPLVAVPDDEQSKAFDVHEWDVVNQSAGGVKVRRVADSLQQLNVGDVIGLKFMGKPRWTIGVVRWLTILDQGSGVEFGAQFLSTAAQLVWMQPTIAASPQAKAALLLADGIGGTDSLLAPLNTYSDLREFEVEHDGHVSTVRATNLIEKTARFELFHVSPS